MFAEKPKCTESDILATDNILEVSKKGNLKRACQTDAI